MMGTPEREPTRLEKLNEQIALTEAKLKALTKTETDIREEYRTLTVRLDSFAEAVTIEEAERLVVRHQALALCLKGYKNWRGDPAGEISHKLDDLRRERESAMGDIGRMIQERRELEDYKVECERELLKYEDRQIYGKPDPNFEMYPEGKHLTKELSKTATRLAEIEEALEREAKSPACPYHIELRNQPKPEWEQ